MEFKYQMQPGRTRMERNLVTDGAPEVTIVTAYFNGAKTLEQTFNCVMNQTFPWFEWIIVDDGSTRREDTEFAQRLAASDPRVRVVRKENGGPADARNYGISLARTQYVAVLDCDDLVEPTFLEYGWWMLEHTPQAAWAYTDSVGFEGIEYVWDVPFDPERMKTANHLTVISMLRKSWFDRLGGYQQLDTPCDEDWHYWLRVLAKGGFPVQAQGGDRLIWYRRSREGRWASAHEQDERLDRRNAEWIAQAAAQVHDPHPPVIYPVHTAGGSCRPVRSAWKRTVFCKHDKIHLTVLIPELSEGSGSRFALELLAGLDRSRYELSVLTTGAGSQPWAQLFRQQTPEVFNLANFMPPEQFPEFVSYFIQSRETDVLLVAGSRMGYHLLPWLRLQFPGLLLMDFVSESDPAEGARISGAMAQVLETTCVDSAAAGQLLRQSGGRQPGSITLLQDQRASRLDETIRRQLADPECAAQRRAAAERLKGAAPLTEELLCVETQLQRQEQAGRFCEQELAERVALHEQRLAQHEEVLERHEEVVNRHEEVVNRHEEVVNRHEQVINDDWAWLKRLEERVTQLEKRPASLREWLAAKQK